MMLLTGYDWLQFSKVINYDMVKGDQLLFMISDNDSLTEDDFQ